LSRDTYDGKLIDPLSQNHYLYAGGNPVLFVDPSGHFFGGMVSMGMSIMSTIVSGYPRIASTVENGAVVALYAKTLIIGLKMREDALNSIIDTIVKNGYDQKGIDAAYKKYNAAIKYISLMTGNANEVYIGWTWTRASATFVASLSKIPIARYSTLPSRYMSLTNSLNQKVAIGLTKVVKDKIGFEETMEILKEQTQFWTKWFTKGL
jgi:hypothetical protein